MGWIEVICGPMFSGKTEELIRRLRRIQIARQHVVVFKPKIDDRYDATHLVSHSKQMIPSISVDRFSNIEAILQAQQTPIHAVGIDEAQFFDSSLVELVERLAKRNIRVILAGLDQDYLGKPFGPMPELLAIADSLTKQTAVCMVCGLAASKTQRIHDGIVSQQEQGDLILVGALERYEARCRRCHVPGLDLPYHQKNGVENGTSLS